MAQQKEIKVIYKYVIIFFTAICLETIGISGFHFLIEKNFTGMVIMAVLNPLLCLPMNHFSIEAKTFKDRFYVSLAFSLGFGIGVALIRPLIL